MYNMLLSQSFEVKNYTVTMYKLFAVVEQRLYGRFPFNQASWGHLDQDSCPSVLMPNEELPMFLE